MTTNETGELTRIFVYGTLMPGHVRGDIIPSEYFASPPVAARTRGKELFYYEYGHFPIAVHSYVSGENQKIIKGQLLHIKSEHIKNVLSTLDEIEGVSSGLFRRIRTYVCTLEAGGNVFLAHMYVASEVIAERIKDFPVVTHGDWTTFCEERIDDVLSVLSP